jgi:peptidoglycan/LPS O-acetylase OafA/YrhL
LPAYLDTFSFGIACAYALHYLRTTFDMDRQRLWATLGTAAFFLAIVGLLQNCSDHLEATAGREGWQVFGRPIVAAAFFGFALCACSAYRAMRRLIGNPFLIFVSTISYNIFLWHHLIAIYLYDHKFPPTAHNVAPHDDPNWGWPFTLVAFPLAFAIPYVITHLFEKPILESPITTWALLRRIRDRFVPKRLAVEPPVESV